MDEQLYNRVSEWVAAAEPSVNEAVAQGEESVKMFTPFMVAGLSYLRQLLAQNPPTSE